MHGALHFVLNPILHACSIGFNSNSGAITYLHACENSVNAICIYLEARIRIGEEIVMTGEWILGSVAVPEISGGRR